MSRLSRIVWRTLKPIRSEFRPDVFHPAGSEGWPVTPIDAKLGVCLFEIRVPDDQLVGGASYDVVTVDVSDLEVDDSAPWAMAPARQAGEAFKSFDGQAAKSVGVRIVLSRMMAPLDQYDVKDAACAKAFAARTPEEYEAAHVAMRAAFPEIAKSYACDCTACRRTDAS